MESVARIHELQPHATIWMNLTNMILTVLDLYVSLIFMPGLLIFLLTLIYENSVSYFIVYFRGWQIMPCCLFFLIPHKLRMVFTFFNG